MAKPLAALALAATLLLIVPTGAPAFKRTEVGQALKDFSLESAAGGSVRLSESLGAKATLLVFWATWSPRSAEALAEFQRLYEEHRGAGLQVVAVNVEHQTWDPADGDRLAEFVRTRGLAFPVLFDKDLTVFNDYGVIAVPSTVLAGPEGRILELLEGYANMTRDDFRERVLRVLGVLPPEPEERAGPTGYQPRGKAARYVQMGQILLQREMPSKAERAFRQALEEDPQWPEAYRGLAEALEAEGKDEEASLARARAAGLAGEVGAPASAPAPAANAGPDPAAERYLRMGILLLDNG
ncbi:MAG: redoxin domain-containing protein, partial [Proteobacteria bacterium]|nr:redoxin domain-containing protein [Pseudomonadota bacterium]